MPIFGHSKFHSVFLYQKGSNEFRMCIFGHFEFIPVFLGKIFRKNSEWPFLAFQIDTSHFGKNCQKKFRMAIFLTRCNNCYYIAKYRVCVPYGRLLFVRDITITSALYMSSTNQSSSSHRCLYRHQ